MAFTGDIHWCASSTGSHLTSYDTTLYFKLIKYFCVHHIVTHQKIKTIFPTSYQVLSSFENGIFVFVLVYE